MGKWEEKVQLLGGGGGDKGSFEGKSAEQLTIAGTRSSLNYNERKDKHEISLESDKHF